MWIIALRRDLWYPTGIAMDGGVFMQQTFEFSTVAHNGFIKIPDEYVHQVGSRIIVVLYTDDKPNRV